MTAYARSDVVSIALARSETFDAHVHERKIVKKGKGDRPHEDAKEFAVDCVCEPVLIAEHGWSRRADDVEQTPDEIRQQEKAEREGSVLVRNMAEAMAQQAAKAMRESGPAAA